MYKKGILTHLNDFLPNYMQRKSDRLIPLPSTKGHFKIVVSSLLHFP